MFRDESECERERERERESYYFNQHVIKIIYIFFFAFMNSTHIFLDVYCSNGAKIFRFSSTAGASF